MKDIDIAPGEGLPAQAPAMPRIGDRISLPAAFAALVSAALLLVALNGHDWLRAAFWALLAIAWILAALPGLRRQRPLRLLGVGCALLALAVLAVQVSGRLPAGIA